MALKYPYSKPVLSEDDIAAVANVLRSGQLTQGGQVTAFEDSFLSLTGAAEAVSCCNGTAALHLAYLAAELGPERGLLTTPITFLSTASAARMTGAPIAFADVDPTTGNIDPESVRQVLQNPPFPIAAIAVVHMGGRPCHMTALKKIADQYGCLLIEDASHGVGASYLRDDGLRVQIGACADSDLATFSFHAIKHIAMGEGGCVTTADEHKAEKMRHLRCHAMSRDSNTWSSQPETVAPWYYEMDQLGWNYRLTDFQCALGTSQIPHIADHRKERDANAALYDANLTGTPHLQLPAPRDGGIEHAWHLYTVFIDFAAVGKTRGEVMTELAKRGIGSQVHYIPLYHQPYFKTWVVGSLPGAEQYYDMALSLPLYLGLKETDIDYISNTLKDILA